MNPISFSKFLVEKGPSYAKIATKFETYDSVIITAFRGVNSKAENVRRNKRLEQDLKSLSGVSYRRAEGHYVENFGNQGKERDVHEKSFVIFFYPEKSSMTKEQFKKEMIKLGEKYNQDSILYKPSGSKENAVLIGTNSHDEAGEEISFPGKGNEVPVGTFVPMQMDQFYTKIKKNKTFVFRVVAS